MVNDVTEPTLTESVSRWMAQRITRRNFFHRVGKFAVVVAGGPALVALMARRAEARVCGQSGVSEKCATFDCTGPNQVWGWCWYASPGCCTDHGLKKICDCCETAFPNVHGYCPEGTNVRCVVESCYADPRIMNVGVVRYGAIASAIDAAVVMSQFRFASTTARVVVADANDMMVVGLAHSVAGALHAPLLLTSPDSLASQTSSEIARLSPGEVVVVGNTLSPTVVAALGSAKPARLVTRVGIGASIHDLSLQVARYVLAITGSRRVACLSALAPDPGIVSAVGAACSASGMALVFGSDVAAELANGPAATRTLVTYAVGPEVAAKASSIPGGNPVYGDTAAACARGINSVVVGAENVRGVAVIVCPLPQISQALGLAGGGLLLFADTADLDVENRAWIRSGQPSLSVGLVPAAASAGQVYELQSALNHFDTHRLMGVPGEGLPVIHQPDSEKAMGQAKIDGVAIAPASFGGYWTGRANPLRP